MSRRHKPPPQKPYYGDEVNPYSKYRAKRVEIDGHKFASKMESRRYLILKDMQREGLIRDLELQPRFRLEVNGVKIADYIADFAFTDVETGERIIDDTKGVVTPAYRMKRALMKAIHGIVIHESTA